ncbi:MAG: glutathione S-transferase N-terminal domain-containing protein, partial [Acetobacter sp.]|nr:glutathione S-transferase N-terminal domain-containing protein [Acetobacter sp.]
MRTLFHFPLCPNSRTIRLVLTERRLAFEPVVERLWEQRPEFLVLNPAGDLPVLVESNGFVVPSVYVIN